MGTCADDLIPSVPNPVTPKLELLVNGIRESGVLRFRILGSRTGDFGDKEDGLYEVRACRWSRGFGFQRVGENRKETE